MAEANEIIMSELKSFLGRASGESPERERYVFSPRAFTRKRILTFQLMVLLVTNALKRTLSLELQTFFACSGNGKSCSKQAFCEQRGKLKPTFFHDWNRVLTEGFYRHYGERAKTWKNMTVWAIDGSTIPLPQTEALREVFGNATNQSPNAYNVTARACLVSDVLNGLVVKGSLHPYFSSEKEACLHVLDTLDTEGKLLVFDRGYPSFYLEYLLMQKGAKFIMRVKKNENRAVVRFLESGMNDLTEDWHPSCKSLKKLQSIGIEADNRTSIKIRMVKVPPDTGETEILITSLYDRQTYSAASLKEAYRFRWGVETDYGNLKEKLQLAQFSGIRQICIEQDFAANLFVYNLQSLIEKQTEPYTQALSRKRKHRCKVNRNVSYGMLKDRVVKLFSGNDCRKTLRELAKLFGNYLEPVRPGRKYLRKQKPGPPGKYHTQLNHKRAL